MRLALKLLSSLAALYAQNTLYQAVSSHVNGIKHPYLILFSLPQ